MSIQSMTGFARCDGAHGDCNWHWEAKSVNNRGLDVRLRLPPGYDALEPKVREAVAKRFSRGSINIALTVDRTEGTAEIRLNETALAQVIACDLHPLDNLRVLKYLKDALGRSEDERNAWYRHWVAKGLAAFEALVAGHKDTGKFCHGDMPGLADITLVPQIFNAKRFDCPLDDYPAVMAIFDNCMTVEAFDKAQPDKQPDAG